MFVLQSDISIGDFIQVKPYEVKISKSIHRFTDTALIKLPISARLHTDGKFQLMTVTAETAKLFKEGDKVVIKLGYNGVLKTEFEGFICRINYTKPLEIECEGYSYQLRRVQQKGTFKNIKLIDVLKKIIKGTDIILDNQVPTDFEISKILMDNRTGTDVLKHISDLTNGKISFFFTGNILYGGLRYIKSKADVKYQLGWNVIKDNNLKKRQTQNNDVVSVWIGLNKDGTKTKVQAGKQGITKVNTTHFITDKSSLQQVCDEDNAKRTYDGYEGRITAFGQPYCEPGYKAILSDNVYKEREGSYIVNSTDVTYGINGFRRIVGIGHKL